MSLSFSHHLVKSRHGEVKACFVMYLCFASEYCWCCWYIVLKILLFKNKIVAGSHVLNMFTCLNIYSKFSKWFTAVVENVFLVFVWHAEPVDVFKSIWGVRYLSSPHRSHEVPKQNTPSLTPPPPPPPPPHTPPGEPAGGTLDAGFVCLVIKWIRTILGNPS